MRNGLLPGVLTLIVLLSACSSGKQAYERGEYYEAVMLSIGRLKQNPGHSKSAEALRNAYPLAVDWLENDAKNQIASNNSSKYKNALVSYEKINNMYEAIKQSPGALKVVPNPKNYYSEIGPLKEKAAEELYNQGIASLMKGTREDAKRAFFQFKESQNYVSDYKDVLDYINKAKFEATVFVILNQVAIPTRYNLSGGFFQDKIEEYLHNNYPDQGFVKFYTPQEAESIRLQRVDQYLKLQFDDFTVGNIVLKQNTETVTKDSVILAYTDVKETKTGTDGKPVTTTKKVPVYGTVKAKLTTYHKEVSSSGLLSMVVIDAKTDGILKHEKFSDTYVWVTEWGNFNGDERALTQTQLAACNRKEISPPDNQQLFLEFAGPIYNKMIPVLNGFYRNY